MKLLHRNIHPSAIITKESFFNYSYLDYKHAKQMTILMHLLTPPTLHKQKQAQQHQN